MNNILKIGISAALGALLGAAITYVVMERLINWFDLVFASASAEVTVSALETFDREGAEQGIEAVRDILRAELEVAKVKCKQLKCSESPAEFASEIRAINRAREYLEGIPIK